MHVAYVMYACIVCSYTLTYTCLHMYVCMCVTSIKNCITACISWSDAIFNTLGIV